MTEPGEPGTVDRGRDRERGFAMILVLWVVVALGLEIALLSANARDAVHLADNEGAIVRGEALAHAAVEIAMANILAQDEKARWTPDGGRHVVSVDGIEIGIRVGIENGKVNLNRADALLLRGIFSAVTRSERDAEALADRVVKWREGGRSDDSRSGIGVTAIGAGRNAAGREFLDAADLARVAGLSADVVERLLPDLTVYTRDGRINPMVARETVLRALPGVPRQAIDELQFMRRLANTAHEQVLALLGGAQAYITGEIGPAVRIEVEIGGSTRAAIGSATTIVLPNLDNEVPFRTLAWRFQPTTRLRPTGASATVGAQATPSRSPRP